MSKSEVQAQYEAYPYPERHPEEEKSRLISGSPSLPVEIDHWIFGGARDWSTPLKVLVAGGGTGDGLVQIAALLTAAERPYEITYVDLSRASREVAEARIRVRGLKGVRFVTGSLLDAPELGRFDYIDCCGVLHHLPEPQAGFDALAGALAPGGGMGLMVYAPYGRSGVYPLQEAFGALCEGMTPEARLQTGKAVFAAVPEGHAFKRNPFVGDHKVSDAGFYDLLMHTQDRPYSIDALAGALDAAGLEIAGFAEPVLYDLAAVLPKGVAVPEGLGKVARMAVAEKLRGAIKTHVVYAARQGEVVAPPWGQMEAVPHLRGFPPAKLAQVIAKQGLFETTSGGIKTRHQVPKSAGAIVAGVNGQRTLGEIAAGVKRDPIAFQAAWGPVQRILGQAGFLHFSRLMRR